MRILESAVDLAEEFPLAFAVVGTFVGGLAIVAAVFA